MRRARCRPWTPPAGTADGLGYVEGIVRDYSGRRRDYFAALNVLDGSVITHASHAIAARNFSRSLITWTATFPPRYAVT